MPTKNPSKELSRLSQAYWSLAMRERPLSATFTRHPGFDDRLDDNTSAGRKRQVRALLALLKAVDRLDVAALPEDGRVTWEVLRWQLSMGIERTGLNFHQWGGFSTVGVDHVSGIHAWISTVVEVAQPMRTARDAAALERRIRALRPYFRSHVRNLKDGLREGRVPARIPVERTIRQLAEMAAAKPEETAFAKAVERLPEPLRAAARRRIFPAVERHAFPAYRDYLKFLRGMKARARDERRPGARFIKDGDKAYRFLIRYHTTLDLTPEELHETGKAELRAIHEELARIADMDALRRDPANFFRTREEIVEHAKALVTRTYELLPKFFKTLPKTPLEVKPIEDYKEKNDVGARYSGPPSDLSRPGVYYVNTYEPKTRSRFGMASLTAHEGVPGHHLQIALAVENRKLPAFQRQASSTAFVEGWALYSERLAVEMGLYRDDLERAGMLSNQAFRAARLVVDTGLHAMGWSRKRAIAFMSESTPMSKAEIESEVDRYTVWPGQALAYMAGQLAITRLRRDLEKRLGPRFDLREFHDAVLRHGPLPLSVLKETVERALEGKAGRAEGPTPL